jgi:hypothetical protein
MLKFRLILFAIIGAVLGFFMHGEMELSLWKAIGGGALLGLIVGGPLFGELLKMIGLGKSF